MWPAWWPPWPRSLVVELVLHPARPHLHHRRGPRTWSPWSTFLLVAGIVARWSTKLSTPLGRLGPRPGRGRGPGPGGRRPGRRRRRRSTRWSTHLRTTFELDAVSLLAARDPTAAGRSRPSPGDRPPPPPDGAPQRGPASAGAVLVYDGPGAHASTTSGCCGPSRPSSARALERRRLRAEAAEAAALAEANELRTAILRAVSHDLRTPLASIKASATSLLQDDVEWTPEAAPGVPGHHRRGGRPAQHPGRQPARHEPAARAACCEVDLRAGGPRGGRGPGPGQPQPADRPQSRSTCPSSCPRVLADAALLERVVANVVANALALLARGPTRCASRPARSATGSTCASSTRARACAPTDRERVFEPFQRLGDRATGTGVGLGPGRGPGLHRRHGRRADPRGHPRRRPDHGDLAASQPGRLRLTGLAGQSRPTDDRGPGAMATRAGTT